MLQKNGLAKKCVSYRLEVIADLTDYSIITFSQIIADNFISDNIGCKPYVSDIIME
tara:strand:+ start:44 stop:211 length:168 start_codon:yes stop_codon:yes gene_type:complete